MIRWRLESMKMAIYMMFPVGVYWCFNQPQLFEDWMMAKRKELFPPEPPGNRALLQATFAEINKKRDKEMEEAMNKYNR